MRVPPADPDLVRSALRKVLRSEYFSRSPQARKFFEYVTEFALSEQSEELKAYTIGVSALSMNAERSCPETTARMQASRVRRFLTKYYAGPGQNDPLELRLPTGSYVPVFIERGARQEESRRAPNMPVVLIETFDCMSSEPLDEALCRGLAGRIVSHLVPVEGLAVVRPSPHRPAESADFCLTGTLSRAGDAVRITASLEGPDGGKTIWTDRFDIRLDPIDLHAQEDTLAHAIASQLADPVVGAVSRTVGDSSDPAGAVRAFYRYLRGPSGEALTHAKRMLELRMPDGGGHGQLHAAYACTLLLEQLNFSSSAELLGSADAHARSAVLDSPQSSLAHLARALVSYQRRERTLARQSALRALDTAGISPFLRAAIGNLLALLGDAELGSSLVTAAFETCPELPRYLRFGQCLVELLERSAPARALPLAGEIASVLPLWGHLLEAASLVTLGRPVEARRAASLSVPASGARIPAHRIEKLVRAVVFDEAWATELLAAAADAGIVAQQASPAPARFSVAVGSSRRRSSEIPIGIVHSLSGPMALCESHLVNAAMLAIDEINRDGGLLGRPLRPIVEDGASDPHVFAQKAEHLAKTVGVEHIFGCWMSSCRKAVLPAIELEDALLWYPMQYEGLEQSKNVVYTGSCLNQQIEPAVRWAMKQGHLRCLLVGSDYVFPRTAHRLIRGLVESLGGRIVGEFHEPLGQGNFDRVAETVATENPDIVFNTVNGVDNIALFQALGRARVRATATPVLSFSLSEIELAKLGGQATGHLACWSYFQSFATPENLSLIDRFRARYGRTEVLSDPVATAYAQVHLFKDVAERIGDVQSAAVRAALPGSEMKLGGETLLVRDNLHIQRRATIGRARSDEQFEIVWRGPQLIEPEPWLGVDQANLVGRELVLEALRALPEMAERTARLETLVSRAHLIT